MLRGIVPIAGAALLLLGLLAWSVWRVFRPVPVHRSQPLVFLSLVSLALLVLRWPQIQFGGMLNVDEAQMLAQGMRFLSHPVPWRDVDGTTGGPLDSMLLSVPMFFGSPATFQTARIVLWVSISLTLVFLYLGLRAFGTPAEAQLVLMTAIFFYAFATDSDCQHYSSETLPVLLLSAGLYLLAREWTPSQPTQARLFVLGLILGAVPFAKLQAAPLAMFLGMVGLALVVLRRQPAERPQQAWLWDGGALCLGALVVPILVLGTVIANGAFADFWTSYILASAEYATVPAAQRLSSLGCLIFDGNDFNQLVATGLGVMALLVVLRPFKKGRLPGNLFWPLVLILADGALTLGCLFLAGRRCIHYLNLLVPAVTALIGLTFFAGKALLVQPGEAIQKRCRFAAIWFLAFCAFVIVFQLNKGAWYFLDTLAQAKLSTPVPLSSVAQHVLAATKPGDALSMWGWAPEYYVETGLPPANRDCVGPYVISRGRYQSFFRKRYLADLERSRPPVFIDAVADGEMMWTWSHADTHESFPELARFINENYTLSANIRLHTGGTPVRVYVLNERWAKLQGPRADRDKPSSPTSSPPYAMQSNLER